MLNDPIILTILLLLLATFCSANLVTDVNGKVMLSRLLKNLGWKIFTITGITKKFHIINFQKYFSKNYLQTNGIMHKFSSDFAMSCQKFESSRTLWYFQKGEESLLERCVHFFKPDEGIILTDLLTTKYLNFLQNINVSTTFHHIQIDFASKNVLNARNVVLFKREKKIVYQLVKVQAESANVQYNLQGAQITSVTLPWMPILDIEECSPGGINCKTHGILPDLMNELGSLYNFTWSTDKEPNGKWGGSPLNGASWFDKNASFTGVVGRPLNGEYDLSLTVWTLMLGRYEWIDYTSTIFAGKYVIMFNLNSKPLDWSLFIRPSTNWSWTLSSIILMLVLGLILILNYINNR